MLVSRYKNTLFMTLSKGDTQKIIPYTNFTTHMKKLTANTRPSDPLILEVLAALYNYGTGLGTKRNLQLATEMNKKYPNVVVYHFTIGTSNWLAIGLKEPLVQELVGLVDWEKGITSLDKHLPNRSLYSNQPDCIREVVYAIQRMWERPNEYYELAFSDRRISLNHMLLAVKGNLYLSKLLKEPIASSMVNSYMKEFVGKLASFRGTNPQLVEKLLQLQ